MLGIIFIVAMMIFLFGITVFVHEWGHFYVAKKCGLKVEAFSIGVGPAIWEERRSTVSSTKSVHCRWAAMCPCPSLTPSAWKKSKGTMMKSRANYCPMFPPGKKSPWRWPARYATSFSPSLSPSSSWQCRRMKSLKTTGSLLLRSRPTARRTKKGLRGGDQILAVNGTPVDSWYETRVESLLGGGSDQVIDLMVINPEDGQRVLTLKANHPEDSQTLIDGVSEASPCQIFPGG